MSSGDIDVNPGPTVSSWYCHLRGLNNFETPAALLCDVAHNCDILALNETCLNTNCCLNLTLNGSLSSFHKDFTLRPGGGGWPFMFVTVYLWWGWVALYVCDSLSLVGVGGLICLWQSISGGGGWPYMFVTVYLWWGWVALYVCDSLSLVGVGGLICLWQSISGGGGWPYMFVTVYLWWGWVALYVCDSLSL